MSKQGTGRNSSAPKTEPQSNAINLKAVADIGTQQMRTKPVALVQGRGAKSPGPLGHSTCKSGSQGRH